MIPGYIFIGFLFSFIIYYSSIKDNIIQYRAGNPEFTNITYLIIITFVLYPIVLLLWPLLIFTIDVNCFTKSDSELVDLAKENMQRNEEENHIYDECEKEIDELIKKRDKLVKRRKRKGIVSI